MISSLVNSTVSECVDTTLGLRLILIFLSLVYGRAFSGLLERILFDELHHLRTSGSSPDSDKFAGQRFVTSMLAFSGWDGWRSGKYRVPKKLLGGADHPLIHQPEGSRHDGLAGIQGYGDGTNSRGRQQ